MMDVLLDGPKKDPADWRGLLFRLKRSMSSTSPNKRPALNTPAITRRTRHLWRKGIFYTTREGPSAGTVHRPPLRAWRSAD